MKKQMTLVEKVMDSLNRFEFYENLWKELKKPNSDNPKPKKNSLKGSKD